MSLNHLYKPMFDAINSILMYLFRGNSAIMQLVKETNYSDNYQGILFAFTAALVLGFLVMLSPKTYEPIFGKDYGLKNFKHSLVGIELYCKGVLVNVYKNKVKEDIADAKSAIKNLKL